MSIAGYYYLHTNGELIYKPYDDGRVADFRESPFVRHFWPMDPEDRENAWTILVEAGAIGAKPERISELAAKWECTEDDAEIYAARMGVKLELDGDQWCAKGQKFIDLQASKAGFGKTKLLALIDLCRVLGMRASKMWGPTFAKLAAAP